MTEPRGEVYDLGYQHYTGPREGRGRARKALRENGVRTVMGLGRGNLPKVLTILLFVAAMIPAVVFALIASVAGSDEIVPGSSDYYQVVVVVLLLYAAVTAPELLSADRRERVLNLYLVRPLTTVDYLIGRWLAFVSVTLAIVYSGQVVLFVGLTLGAPDAAKHLADNWLDVPRFLAAGLIVAVFTTTITMAVSAFTTRRAYAGAFIIGMWFLTAIISGIFTEPQCEVIMPENPERGEVIVQNCEPLLGDSAKWAALIDIGRTPIHLNDLIFNVDSENADQDAGARLVREEFPAAVPIGMNALFIVGAGFLLWSQYRRISV